MLAFTTDFKTAAQADIRDPRALVRIHWGNTLQDTGVTVAVNDGNYIDRKGQVRKALTASGGKFLITGESTVDGTFAVAPDADTGPQCGWFTGTTSDGSGNFGSARTLQIDHDSRPYTRIQVVGDSEYNEYPVDFTIDITHDGGTYQIVETGNSDRIYTADFSILTGVTTILLSITKWSAVNTPVKIIDFSGDFVEYFDSDDITGLNLLEEINTDTGNVPIGSVTANEIDLSLLNTEGRFSFGNTDSDYADVLISGRKIEVWLGFVLPSGTSDVTGDVTGYIVLTEGSDKVGYMPYGVYWSKDWESNYRSSETTVTAFDIMGRLRQLDFLRSDNYSDTVENIVDDILANAQLSLPELTWTVSSDTASDTLADVAIGVQNFQEVLKDIAEATLSYSYVDRTGVLIVGSRLGVTTPVAPEQEITLSEYYDFTSTPKIDELINAVRIGYTIYDLAASGENIYTDSTVFEIPAGESELKLFIKWEKAPVLVSSVLVTLSIVTATGAMVLTSTAYANGADITVTGTAGDQFTVSATGRPYTLTEITEAVTEDTESIAKYGRREFSLTGNQLITSAEQAEEMATALLSSYGDLRADGALSWPGNLMVAVGDTVEVTEFESAAVTTTDHFLIKRQNLTFNGALDSSMELRRG